MEKEASSPSLLPSFLGHDAQSLAIRVSETLLESD